MISGDHDHYISSEAIVLPNDAVAYEEAICEPRPKRRKFSFKNKKHSAFLFRNIYVIRSNNPFQCKQFHSTEKLSSKKHQTTYQIISDVSHKNKLGKSISISSNIIEESFANATSNDIFTTFEEELVTDDMKQSTLMNHGTNIEVISNTPIASTSTNRKQDEFDIFGNFVAEVMRNMNKPKSRILQMNIMKLIADAESES